MSEHKAPFLTDQRRERLFRIIVGIGIVLLLMGIAAVSGYGYVSNERVTALKSTLATTRTADAAEYDSVLSKAERLQQQLKDAGKTPAVTLPAPKAVPGVPGARGAAGVSVVGASCTGSGLEMFYSDGSSENAGQCVGAPGEAGKTGATGVAGADGQNATSAQIGAAVAVYCAANGNCQGPAGAEGTNGTNGTNGSDGAAGKDGTGISGVSCVAETDGSTAFRFTFTDGTSQDVAGPCTPPTTSPTSSSTEGTLP